MNALIVAILASAAGADPVWTADLTTSDAGLTPSGTPDQWRYGLIDKGPEPTTGWATRLDRVHMNDADDRLTLPAVSLDGTTRPVLEVVHWLDLEPGDDDFGLLERFDGNDWIATAPLLGPPDDTELSGTGGPWRTDWFDLTGVASLDDVRLRFLADDSVARDGWVVRELSVIDGDPVPPEVTLTAVPEDTEDLPGPYTVEASVVDDVAVAEARLVWFAGDAPQASATMTSLGMSGDAERFAGAIPGLPAATEVIWWVEAADSSGNVGVSTGPVFRVRLPAPTGLTAPSDRIVAPTAPLSWTPPDSRWDIVGYRVYRDGEPVVESVGASVSAPLAPDTTGFQVAALFDVPDGIVEGDLSDPVFVDAHPPAITSVSPSAAWPGDRVRLVVTGRDLLLTADDAALSLGDDITVLSVDVDHVDRLTAEVVVESDASASARDVVVTTAGLDVRAERALVIRSDSTRPRILEITPDRIVRGTQRTFTVSTNADLPDEVRVDLGPGIVVEDTIRTGSRSVRVTATATATATTGDRTPTVDTGTRLLTGRRIEVAAPPPTTSSSCSTAHHERSLLVVILGVVAVGGRRRLRPSARRRSPRPG